MRGRWRDRLLGPARRAPDEVTRVGEYELRVTVLHAGTRSEGRVGRLYRSGVEVAGTQGDVVEADGVRLVHRGDERPHLWAASGWSLDRSG